MEGQGPNPTYYGIPTVHTVTSATLYQDVALTKRLQNLSAATRMEVLGIVNERVLHVRYGDRIGYIEWKSTDYVD